jgi:hypothetical protein
MQFEWMVLLVVCIDHIRRIYRGLGGVWFEAFLLLLHRLVLHTICRMVLKMVVLSQFLGDFVRTKHQL